MYLALNSLEAEGKRKSQWFDEEVVSFFPPKPFRLFHAAFGYTQSVAKECSSLLVPKVVLINEVETLQHLTNSQIKKEVETIA
jgi:hypothetical protein